MENIKKINNRIGQKKYDYYKNSNEITEIIFYMEKYIDVPPCVSLALDYFRKTSHGSTQASVKTICEKQGISTSTWDKTVKVFFENALEIPIIKTAEGPRKFDRSKKRKVRGCQYKWLQPFHLLKKAIERKVIERQKEEQKEELRIQEEIRRDEILLFGKVLTESENESDNTVKEEVPNPCGSMSEDGFSTQHISSFRENLLEKDLNKLNIQSNFIEKNLGKIKIKTDIKNYLNTFPLFRNFHSWTESKRYEIAKTIQLAVIKTKTDIEEIKSQHMIKNAVSRLMEKYSDKPQNEFLRLLYTYVFNDLENPQEEDSEPSEDDSDFWTSSPILKILEEREKNELNQMTLF